MTAQLPLFQDPVRVMVCPDNLAWRNHSGVGHLLIAESIRQFRIDEKRAKYGRGAVSSPPFNDPQFMIASCGGMAGEW